MAGPVRACFRLVEPVDDEEWQVRFGPQAADEPSLVVEAEAVWRSRGKLPALARHVEAPQETFLAELGKAARLYPELDRALRTARPSHLALDTEVLAPLTMAAAVRDDPSSQPIAVGLSRLLFVVFLFLAWGNATFLLAIITLFAWMRQFRYA